MRVRKSTIAMLPGEWIILNNAIDQLVQSGKWHDLYLGHAEPGVNHRMHGSRAGAVGYARFLYWHRAYVLECENNLREINDSITIPYWDWLNSEGVPTGLNHMPIRGVNRNTGNINFTDANEIQRIMGLESFDSFVRDLENNPHNRGHNWVGGIMSNPIHSPLDPLFYMHHANIDRIWSEWQATPGNENKKPEISDADSLLDPWEGKWNIDNIHNISDLDEYNYRYDPASAINLSLEILERLRNLEELKSPIPRIPDPFPNPWPPEPIPRPGPRPGPRPDPAPDILDRLSHDEIAMIRMMRTFKNR